MLQNEQMRAPPMKNKQEEEKRLMKKLESKCSHHSKQVPFVKHLLLYRTMCRISSSWRACCILSGECPSNTFKSIYNTWSVMKGLNLCLRSIMLQVFQPCTRAFLARNDFNASHFAGMQQKGNCQRRTEVGIHKKVRTRKLVKHQVTRDVPGSCIHRPDIIAL